MPRTSSFTRASVNHTPMKATAAKRPVNHAINPKKKVDRILMKLYSDIFNGTYVPQPRHRWPEDNINAPLKTLCKVSRDGGKTFEALLYFGADLDYDSNDIPRHNIAFERKKLVDGEVLCETIMISFKEFDDDMIVIIPIIQC